MILLTPIYLNDRMLRQMMPNLQILLILILFKILSSVPHLII